MWLGALALAKTGTPSLFEINPANIAFLQFWVKCAQTGLPFGLRVRVTDANDKNVANLVCVVFFLFFFSSSFFFFSFSFPCLIYIRATILLTRQFIVRYVFFIYLFLCM